MSSSVSLCLKVKHTHQFIFSKLVSFLFLWLWTSGASWLSSPGTVIRCRVRGHQVLYPVPGATVCLFLWYYPQTCNHTEHKKLDFSAALGRTPPQANTPSALPTQLWAVLPTQTWTLDMLVCLNLNPHQCQNSLPPSEFDPLSIYHKSNHLDQSSFIHNLLLLPPGLLTTVLPTHFGSADCERKCGCWTGRITDQKSTDRSSDRFPAWKSAHRSTRSPWTCWLFRKAKNSKIFNSEQQSIKKNWVHPKNRFFLSGFLNMQFWFQPFVAHEWNCLSYIIQI